MHHAVESKRSEVADVCRALWVRRLDVFGSAVGDRFNAQTSDVDLLVEFDPTSDFDFFDQYFSLKEELEKILGRPADRVTVSSVHNPYFKRRVMETRETLYAA